MTRVATCRVRVSGGREAEYVLGRETVYGNLLICIALVSRLNCEHIINRPRGRAAAPRLMCAEMSTVVSD